MGRYYRWTESLRRLIDVISRVVVSAAIERQGPRCWMSRCVHSRAGTVACDLTFRRRLPIENLGSLNSEAGIGMTNVRTTTLREYERVGPLSSWEIETTVSPDDGRSSDAPKRFPGRSGTRPRMEARLRVSSDYVCHGIEVPGTVLVVARDSFKSPPADGCRSTPFRNVGLVQVRSFT